jgi:hypothetical protein
MITQTTKCTCPTCTCQTTAPNPSGPTRPRRLPSAPLRPRPVSPGSLRELFWRHGKGLGIGRNNHDSSPDLPADSSAATHANLCAWVYRRRDLDTLDMGDPADVRAAENLRLNDLIDRLSIGQSWAAGGSVHSTRSGWPMAFSSRVLRPRRTTMEEVAWISSVCALRAKWLRRRGGWILTLELPGSVLPAEFN